MDIRTTGGIAVFTGIGSVLVFALIFMPTQAEDVYFLNNGAGGGGVTSVNAGSGISVNQTTGNVLVNNTGVLSLSANSPVTVNASTGNVLISCSTCAPSTSVMTLICSDDTPESGSAFSCSSFTPNNFLRVFVEIKTSNTMTSQIRFNSDSGSNYAYRYSYNGNADTTATSVSGCRVFGGSSVNGDIITLDFTVQNFAQGDRKSVVGQGMQGQSVGAGTVLNKSEYACGWSNTASNITTITIIDSSGLNSISSGKFRVYGFS